MDDSHPVILVCLLYARSTQIQCHLFPSAILLGRGRQSHLTKPMHGRPSLKTQSQSPAARRSPHRHPIALRHQRRKAVCMALPPTPRPVRMARKQLRNICWRKLVQRASRRADGNPLQQTRATYTAIFTRQRHWSENHRALLEEIFFYKKLVDSFKESHWALIKKPLKRDKVQKSPGHLSKIYWLVRVYSSKPINWVKRDTMPLRHPLPKIAQYESLFLMESH